MLPDIPWFVYAMLLAPVGLIVFAAIYKYLEVRAASDWPSTPGKVVISKPEVRQVKVIDSEREAGHRFEDRNFANVTYEYSVAGQTYRNNRITIGEDRGNFEVAETLARYPVGNAVTVYYNPNKRGEAVLERDMPKGVWGCIGWMVAIAVVLVFGSAIGFHKLTDFVSTRLASPEMSGMTVALGAFGAAIALFALMFQRQASLAKKWPVVQGRIKTSGLEEFRAAPEEGHSHGTTKFQSKVLYSYRYNGIDYTSSQASYDGQVSSTSRWMMERVAKKYPNGKSVEVHVNPENPSQAVLETRTPGVWILWLSAIAIWGIAYFVAIKG
ncbi:MAG TPA: DUF3592 domain-containing protein [Afipia sp.]|uniref:DUF3592 domain-containing protein n=1 Tax=unclassified Afipia TaxID=2642050 RepID=UPI0004635B57|nr:MULTISPECIES: DUF3592 domain-containing protein [unclassified Afipia]MAH70630.1 DUF3592 domain-containing protein [Afipia sp.]OUX60086.1 MAG: DUF3592 domain-containing protein [Afipia sp. TMED4]HAP46088.1 DUF3592 domain-containing protein [Afipia sp.]HBF57670.1 DUF3592 domain-containing protein [Afipia sp.]HBR44106.1 DUF3592 domain-containing protein [Afipia sp.]